MDLKHAWKKLLMGQCRRPSGLLGEYIARRMNRSHYELTGWGLSHVSVAGDARILDIGCGGGRTAARLAGLAPNGHVEGIDASPKSVAMSRRHNRRAIAAGRMTIRQASVSALPFPDGHFDLATAVETHYFWPDLPADLAEVRRVLRPGGHLLLIAEIYKCAKFEARNQRWLALTPMTYLAPDEFRDLFRTAGFEPVAVHEEAEHGWICCVGQNPAAAV